MIKDSTQTSKSVKKYDTYKDSGIEWIGEIPEHWEVTKIGQVYDERNEKVSDKDYPPLSVTKNGVVSQLETAAKTDNGDNRKLVKLNDFAINSRSDRRGSCGISNYEGSVSIINTVLLPRKNMCNKYYNYTFKTECFADEFYKWGNGIVDDLWSTKWSAMKNIYIPQPNLSSQQQIADYLDKKCGEIDRVIDVEKSVIERLKEYKQSIITEAVTKGLDKSVPLKDSGIEWIGEIPIHWEVRRLKMTVNLRNEKVEYNGEKYIGLENVASNTGDYALIDENVVDGVSNKFYSDDGLFSKLRPYLAKVTIVDFTGLCSSEFLVLKDFKGDNRYLLRLLLSYWFIDIVNSSTYGAKMPRASWDFIGNMAIPYPHHTEQQAIADYLDKKCSEIDKLISDKEILIKKLIEYKKSLIYECVTGKRKVI